MSEVSKGMIEAGMKARHGDDVYDEWRDDDIARMETGIREILEAVLSSLPAIGEGSRVERRDAPEPVAWLCEDKIFPEDIRAITDANLAELRGRRPDAWKVIPLYPHPRPEALDPVGYVGEASLELMLKRHSVATVMNRDRAGVYVVPLYASPPDVELVRMLETMAEDPARVNSACISYRHDFGLLPPLDREDLARKAKWWLEAWMKEARAALVARAALSAKESK